MASRMTQELLKMRLRMVSALGDTTPSLAGTDWLAENDSGIGLECSMRKLAGSCGRVSMFTTCLHTTPCPPRSTSINSHPCSLQTTRR
jgi:hypothetical protein